MSDRMNEFQAYAAFVRRYAIAILTAAYVPVLTQSFFPFPRNVLLTSQVPAAASGLLTVLVVAGAFWLRKGIARRGSTWMPVGLVLVVVGMALILQYALVCYKAVENLPEAQREIYRLTRDQALTAFAWYLFAFPVMLAGASIIFLYGFVRFEEPTLTLQSIASDLSEHLRGFLGRIATSMHYVEKGRLGEGKALAGSTRTAFKAGALELLRDTARVLDRIADGTLEIRGPAMDVVYGQCVEAVQRSFRALSGNDLDYWASDDSSEYVEYNRGLLARRCTVERVFLVYRGTKITAAQRHALLMQIDMGIIARVAYFERCRNIAEDKELDFGLLDDFAVSFWRHERGRVFRFTAEAEEYKKYNAIFERVRAVCEPVGDGASGDRSRLTAATLDIWLTLHNA